jgi:toxin HigB-1
LTRLLKVYTNLVYTFWTKVSFASAKLEKLCRQKQNATQAFGPQVAAKLQSRLAELFAAATVVELVAGRPHPLQGTRAGSFALDLHGGYRLIFKPTVQPPVKKPDGSIDWAQVSKVTITEVVNYHD